MSYSIRTLTFVEKCGEVGSSCETQSSEGADFSCRRNDQQTVDIALQFNYDSGCRRKLCAMRAAPLHELAAVQIEKQPQIDAELF